MPEHFADRLTQAVHEKGTCATVGIDPVYSRLPGRITQSCSDAGERQVERAVAAIWEFCTGVLRVVSPLVPAVKLNIAFFERYYGAGLECYWSLLRTAAELGVLTIGDIKRGDIGSTAEAYARGHLAGDELDDLDDAASPDAITVNGFAGLDGVEPFAEQASRTGKGIFVWVRASNPSATSLQEFTDAGGTKWYELLAGQVGRLAGQGQRIGSCGLSDVGMVVGGTTADESARLRQMYPHIVFLVPGYGAQGATAADCLRFCRDDGSGVLITASRSIIYAHENARYSERFGDDWEKCIEQACLDMKSDLAGAVGGD